MATMNNWQTNLKGDSLTWLLEPDEANPGVRYFALRDLLHRPETDPEVLAARRAVLATGSVPAILAAQTPRATGSSRVAVTRPNIGVPSGKLSFWPNLAPTQPTSGSAGAVTTS